MQMSAKKLKILPCTQASESAVIFYNVSNTETQRKVIR